MYTVAKLMLNPNVKIYVNLAQFLPGVEQGPEL